LAISARLSQTLHQELGDEAGEDLVNWMVQMETNRSDLREMMDGYMGRLDRQFASIEHRLVGMDQRFDRIDARFEKVDERLDKIDVRLDKIDVRFERVDARFEQVHRDISSLETRVALRFADLFKWSFVFWCGAVGAIALLARALR
jgi:predicted nuclease with TOPRIM domain